MSGFCIKARECVLKHRTFRLSGGRQFRLDIHDGADVGPGRDGHLSIDGGRVFGFEYLGRGRTRGGTDLAFLRVQGAGRQMILACDGRLRDVELPVGNTHLGFEDLTAALPMELPCFVAGTRLRTPVGMQAVETLKPGDVVLTRDRGGVRVLHALHRRIDPEDETFDDEARPIVVMADAFAPGVPARDLLLSRRQRVMMCGWRADLMTEFRGVLAPAGCLVDNATIVNDTGSADTTFVHLILEEEAVLLAEGLPVVAPGPDSTRPRGYRSITARELDALPLSVHAAPLTQLQRPARPPLGRWEISAIKREQEQGPWSSALRLITVPPSSIESEEPLVLGPPAGQPVALGDAANVVADPKRRLARQLG